MAGLTGLVLVDDEGSSDAEGSPKDVTETDADDEGSNGPVRVDID